MFVAPRDLPVRTHSFPTRRSSDFSRLASLDPDRIDDAMFVLLTQEKRVMPHVHLSLQAGDDMVLTRMKRRHRRADAVRLIERLKAARPDIAIGADLHAGFPDRQRLVSGQHGA